ncbi:hypothetical protein OE88DRAFT_1041570 [Heliocybe sulcata]|uniref:Uncharacterized protein n=1 Tax=Heliocybe sulcata TaxID=5364 RepID=A0A5C3MQ65_9AGAM|nr:hypothetical protein OE88DRAFT_1041570 [Heliocybe sulcata]
MKGIINASKLMLRHWRDVPNTRRLLHAACCQNKLISFYRRCINNTTAQKRWISAAKTLVDEDQQLLPKSDIPATAADRRPGLLLRTLDQTRLAAEDFVDITGQVTKFARSPAAPEEPTFAMLYIKSGHKYIPFPLHSQGFFYWHLEPDAPPVSGQVRFRTTTSSDPATFPGGRDLQLPDGGTWNIPLSRIARASKYSGLRAHLLYEELITEKLLDAALNNPAPAAVRRRTRPVLLLRTLDPTRVDAGDFVDFAGRVTKSARFLMAPEEPSIEMRYFYSRGRNTPFPPDSQGFLYWNIDPDAPCLSGQLRFRTTSSSDPATFPSGRDLQLPDGRTWNISLFEIARGSKYSGLCAHLFSEKLVTAQALNTALNISNRNREKIAADSLLICKFGQGFPVDFRSAILSVWIIGSSEAEVLHLRGLFSVQDRESGSNGTGKTVIHMPYAGRAVIQLERSTLPEHYGTRTVVLRIVEVIQLTKSEGSDDTSGMPEPKEGGLIMTRTRGSHRWRPWSVDVDVLLRGSESVGSSANALAILFNNDAMQASGSHASGVIMS